MDKLISMLQLRLARQKASVVQTEQELAQAVSVRNTVEAQAQANQPVLPLKPPR